MCADVASRQSVLLQFLGNLFRVVGSQSLALVNAFHICPTNSAKKLCFQRGRQHSRKPENPGNYEAKAGDSSDWEEVLVENRSEDCV